MSADLDFVQAVGAMVDQEWAGWKQSNLTDLGRLRAAAARATEHALLLEGVEADGEPRAHLVAVARSHGRAARLRRLVAHTEAEAWDRTATMLEDREPVA